MIQRRAGLTKAMRVLHASLQHSKRYLSSEFVGNTAIYTWGCGTSGQLGHANFDMESGLAGKSYVQLEPRRLAKSKQYTSLSVGGEYSVVLSQSGQLFGFGKGYIADIESKEPVLLPGVDPTIRFVQVSSGSSHCAAIDDKGLVYTWGQVPSGWLSFGGLFSSGGYHLGHGKEGGKSTPRIVDSLREYGAKIASVTCGKKHTLVLSADGEVLSCGAGEYGRLGTGSTSDSSIFESISALAEEDVVQVQAGASHSLALTAEGVVYSWGRNDRGQLGMRDSNMDIYSTEAYPRAIDDTLNSKPEHRAVQIAAGEDRSAYVTADGRLYVWGARLTHFPQLVDPSLFNGLRVRKCIIAGQASASIFAVLTEDHQLWTFGDRNSGLLGVPKPKSAIGVNITKQSTPAPVSAFVGKQVVDVFGGLGTHMAARVVLV